LRDPAAKPVYVAQDAVEPPAVAEAGSAP
jgi:hypothetical protein